jgi:DNA-binding transcriptional MocR family regulator
MSLTLVDSVIRQVRERLAARSLVPGERLPSIRALSGHLGVSKSTVVEAYERLAAEGDRRPAGSGFYVCGHLPPLSLAEIGPALDRSIDPLWISRQALEAAEDSLKPGCGWLPQSWLPEDELRRALRQLAREPRASLLDYGRPYGHQGLREQLSRRLAEHGVQAGVQQIVLTDGGTHAIDLVCRFLLEPGDEVLVDDPVTSTSRPCCAPTAPWPSACPTRPAARTWRPWPASCSATGHASTSPTRPSTTRPARSSPRSSPIAC